MAPSYYDFSSEFNGRNVNIYSSGAENKKIRIEVTKNRGGEGFNSVVLMRENFDSMIDIFLYSRQFIHIIADGRLNSEKHHSTVYSAADCMETDKERCQVIHDYIGVYFTLFCILLYLIFAIPDLKIHLESPSDTQDLIF